MITLEDYELAYNLFEGSRTLEATTDALEIKSLTESSEVIQEGFKETIKNYVNKIITGIQNAWNKFKDNTGKTKFTYSDEDVKKALVVEPHVSVDNYVEYKPNVLNDITIQKLDYNTMQDSLDSEEAFMKKYYASIYTDSKKSIYDNIRAMCMGNKSDKYDIKKEDLQPMIDYLKGYDEFKKKVEKDLETINQAAKSSEYIANNMSEAVNTLKSTMDYYFTEADEENPKPTVNKDETDEANGNKEGSKEGTGENGGEKKEDENSEKVKRIQNYFKCISAILSSEIKISREIYIFYKSVIDRHMFNYKKKVKKQEKKTNTTKEEPAKDEGVKQVNT